VLTLLIGAVAALASPTLASPSTAPEQAPDSPVLEVAVPTSVPTATASTLVAPSTVAVDPTLAPSQDVTPTTAATVRPTTTTVRAPTTAAPTTVAAPPATAAVTTAVPVTTAPTLPAEAIPTTAATTTTVVSTLPPSTAPGIVTRPPTTASTDDGSGERSTSWVGPTVATLGVLAMLGGGGIIALAVIRRRRDHVPAAERSLLSGWLEATADLLAATSTSSEVVRAARVVDSTADVLGTNAGTGVPTFLRAVAALVGNDGIPARDVKGLISAVRGRDRRAAEAMEALVAALFELASRTTLVAPTTGWLRATAALADHDEVARGPLADSLDALAELLVDPSVPRLDVFAERLRPGGAERWWQRRLDTLEPVVARSAGTPSTALAGALANALGDAASVVRTRTDLGSPTIAETLDLRVEADPVTAELDLRERDRSSEDVARS
jgi:hypothetical protein